MSLNAEKPLKRTISLTKLHIISHLPPLAMLKIVKYYRFLLIMAESIMKRSHSMARKPLANSK